jgi:DNA-binding transcriptional LysR family regulator
MELVWIDDFIALETFGNFTEAAIRRNTTQSAFSRRIKTMEDWFGVELFNRNSRPVILTTAGKECKKRIYKIREDIIDMRRIANLSSSSLPDNAIIIYTTNTIAIGYLSAWIIKEKIQNYRVVVSSVTQAIEMLGAGQCDYALIPQFNHDNKSQQMISADLFAKDRLVFIRPPAQSYDIGDGALIGNFLMYAPKTAFGEAINKELKNQNLILKNIPICESSSAEALLAQIRQGIGCGWCVESLLTIDEKKLIDSTMFCIEFDICVASRNI